MDNSGYQLAGARGDINPFGPVIDRNGNTFEVPVNFTSGTGSATDANGNQITVDGSGDFTDTTGQVALTVSTSSPSPSEPQVLTYKDTNGNPQQVTAAYKSYTVQTNFGCSGIGEYNNTASLVDTITYPDGSAYHFTYEATPGEPGSVTGRIASVTLPQGGVIEYTYSGGNNGIVCADGSTAGLTRTLLSDPAGSTYSYARTISSSTTSSTLVSDAANNQSQYSFVLASNLGLNAAYYETQRSIYQGPATSGNLLRSTQTCYNGAPESCTTTSPQLPITQTDTYVAQNGGDQNGSTVTYNQFGLATEKDDYDYGTPSSRGALLQKEVWGYPGGGPMMLETHAIYDGSGNALSSESYGYDSTPLVASSGVPQHVAVSGTRGNPTAIDRWVSTSQALEETTNTYEDTGSLVSSTGPNGTSSYGYDSTFSFQTNVTPPTPSSGVSLPSSASYDINSGLPLNATDPNGATTASSYDSMLRPITINYPDGGTESFTYYSPNQTGAFHTMNSSASTQTQTLLDGYGRLSRVAIYNGQGSNYWYQQDTCYNADGQIQFRSYSYQGTGFAQGIACSGAGDTYSYDALGRVTQILHADGTAKSFYYLGRATEVTDENGVQRITQVDGLGRPAAVCEISANSSMPGSGSPASCGMDIAGTGFLTTYAYSAVGGRSVTVTQGQQTRVFETDGLGRPILVQEPESGTTTYSYAYNSTGLAVTRQRPQANQGNPNVLTTTTTQYDSLGRPVSVTYSDGLTPAKTFAYDAATGWGGTNLGDSKGRMIFALTGSTATGTMYSYDSMGRVTATDQCLPGWCGNSSEDKWVYYSYDYTGDVTSATDGAWSTLSYQYSPAGEVTSITSSYSDPEHPAALVSNIQNGPFGPVSYQLGNGLGVAVTYDTLGRVNGQWVCSGSTQPYCAGGQSQIYGFTANMRGSQAAASCDTVLNGCQVYGYDEFNRLASLTVWSGNAQNFTWTYDRWGNRWAQTLTAGSGPTWNASFNQSANQIVGFSYDAAGNVTSDGVHTYTYDAEGNVVSLDGGNTATYVYDALNHRVQGAGGGGASDYVFNTAGQRVAAWDGVDGHLFEGRAYWGAKPVEYYASGTAHFEHQDWLGTERVLTSYDGQVESSFTSLAFGDGYSATGADGDPYHFAGLDTDFESGTYHAQFRQYSPAAGSWMAPDPYAGSYNFGNPQSFDRYAYTLNNPLAFADPTGLDAYCDTDPDTGDLECTSYYATDDPDNPIWEPIYNLVSCYECALAAENRLAHPVPPSAAPINSNSLNGPSNGTSVSAMPTTPKPHGSGKYSDYLLCVAAHISVYVDPEDYLTPDNPVVSNSSGAQRAGPYLIPFLVGATSTLRNSLWGVVSATATGVIEVAAAAYVNKVCTAQVY